MLKGPWAPEIFLEKDNCNNLDKRKNISRQKILTNRKNVTCTVGMTSGMQLYKCIHLNGAIVYKCIDYRMM